MSDIIMLFGDNFVKFINEKFLVLFCVSVVISGFKLTILHTNDVHTRFEQFDKYGAECSGDEAREGKCFGGVARRYTNIQDIRAEHDNVLLLDAGDQFMGTTWFKVHRGMATAYFMSQLGYDAMCLGNHEFDDGVEGIVNFLYNVTFSVVSANTDVTGEPRLQGKISKSIFTVVGGEKIGIVGYVTPETSQISTPDQRCLSLDSVLCMNAAHKVPALSSVEWVTFGVPTLVVYFCRPRESTKDSADILRKGPTVSFNDILTSVRDEVSKLQEQGVDKIIALGHAGFNIDTQVATIDGIDVVVGGHTNTFLYNGYQPADEKIDGPYPVVVNQLGGGRGLVVQAYTMGKYLGYLNIEFDSDGVVTNYSGQPILLGSNVQEDGVILSYVSEWKKPVEALSKEAIGVSKVFLDGEREHCRLQECNLGNLVTDAIIDYHLNYSHATTQWAPAAIALWNGGGIRASIDKGTVTVAEAVPVMPFGNTLDIVTVKGKNLRDQLEISVQKLDQDEPHGRFLQMSGLHVVYNMQQPAGQRVASVEAICLECDVPSYYPLIDTDEYKIFLSTFLINGGDGYNFEPLKRLRFNTLDFTTFIEYFKRHNPVVATVEGRIKFLTDTTSVATMSSAQVLVVLVAAMTGYVLLPLSL